MSGGDDPARDDIAIDSEGNPLPLAPTEVRAIVTKMIDDGEIMAVVLRAKNGNLGVQVFGPPSRELLEVLETATTALRRALKGH